MQWRDATVGEIYTTGFEASGAGAGWRQPDVSKIEAGCSGLASQKEFDLPCTKDPELFFAEAPEEVEQAKAMCRRCRARLACLAGALERREPCGVWGGELLLRGTIMPRKRPRGRPRKREVAA